MRIRCLTNDSSYPTIRLCEAQAIFLQDVLLVEAMSLLKWFRLLLKPMLKNHHNKHENVVGCGHQ